MFHCSAKPLNLYSFSEGTVYSASRFCRRMGGGIAYGFHTDVWIMGDTPISRANKPCSPLEHSVENGQVFSEDCHQSANCLMFFESGQLSVSGGRLGL